MGERSCYLIHTEQEGLPEEVILEQRPGGKAEERIWIENQGTKALEWWDVFGE